ncbi:MAG: right-handed parallel beta-helix repeat-containing protein [Spirochaetes bacterium]|nr:right-handed parallel beta-helix repeat-containing protein [Spirochaetota bacterium]
MVIKKTHVLFFLILFFLITVATACSDSSGSSDDSKLPDITAPSWNTGYPESVIMDDRLYFKADIDENGHVYCVLLPDNDPAPSPQQIVDGLDAGDTAAPWHADSEVSTGKPETFIFSNLGYSTDYDLYCIAEDSLLNRQASALKLDISVSERNTIFVSENEGDDSNTGTIYLPKATITAGISSAAALFSSEKNVCVSSGTYDESITLSGGISLFGGYSNTDWSDRDIEHRGNPSYSTCISGIWEENSGLDIEGTNPGSGDWIVEGFTIQSGNPDYSIGIHCIAGSIVNIRHNTIRGGYGENDSIGIYLNEDGTAEISDNTIYGGYSSGSTSNGIFIENTASQIIRDNRIDGGGGDSASYGIRTRTFPVNSNTLIINNQIYGGGSGTSVGISMSHLQDNTNSMPLIFGNSIDGGWDDDNVIITLSIAIYITGLGDTRTIEPVICNNILRSGTGDESYCLRLRDIDNHAYILNNTFHLTASSSKGIVLEGSTNRETAASVINNILFSGSDAITENSNTSCEEIQNNVFYETECLFAYGSGDITDIAVLNGLRPNFSGNVSVKPGFNSEYNLSDSSPSSVTQGGLDLSSYPYPYFQENSSGEKIDKAGTVRTAPWSIGAFERD